jgi:hypothetical protein
MNIEIVDREVIQADNGLFYGRWETQTMDDEGYISSSIHFTSGFESASKAQDVIPKQ